MINLNWLLRLDSPTLLTIVLGQFWENDPFDKWDRHVDKPSSQCNTIFWYSLITTSQNSVSNESRDIANKKE